MKAKKKHMIILAAVLLAALVIITVVILLMQQTQKESQIYALVSPYRNGSQEWNTPDPLPYPEDSGEAIFLSGMDSFASKDYDAASERFRQALSANRSDPALETYLYYYLNQCTYLVTGTGDYVLVSSGMDAASSYTPLANDADMLWDMVSTIALGSKADIRAIPLIEEYLSNNSGLELETWANLSNCAAMLEYMNEEYAEGIRDFYDVELALENTDLTPQLSSELQFAREYIANIHVLFEDDEKAIELYRELIGYEPDASSYSYLLNMASAYLELSDTESARETMQQLDQILPLLDDDTVEEVEAAAHDVFANICMIEGNYAEAGDHIEQSLAYYDNNTGAAFYGGQYAAALTHSRYLLHEGDYQQMLQLLDIILSTEDAAARSYTTDACELLVQAYSGMGDTAGMKQAYERLLERIDAFSLTTQREYLNFSEYYRDAKILEYSNERLYRISAFSILGAVLIAALLIAVLFFVRRLRRRNMTDQLTRVYNRKKLTQIASGYDRSGTPANLGVVMMDIDYFKRYNDNYGHPAGDEVLREVAGVVTESVRKNDIVIRYGGEEFLVLLLGVSFSTAQDICARIHSNLKDRAIPHEHSDAASHVTLSMGLCYHHERSNLKLTELIKNADECLYQSKEAGRNRVTAAEI